MRFLTPPELRSLSQEDAKRYCSRLRRALIASVGKTGGHLASNLGIVEISVGLMRVFSPPHDQIIYDVGHQSYVHKMLTGRGDKFATLREYGGLSGFTRREESRFDPFGAGHSSTAISAALGMARARDVKKEKDKSAVIAVVGDGAMSGGMVYEALNNIKPTDRVIIVLNDNEMSISKNVGAMSKYFTKMRSSAFYYPFKHKTRTALSSIPVFGEALTDAIQQTKTTIKKMVYPTALDPFGVYYLGPADGNDLKTVEMLFREAAAVDGPVLIHLCTKKGKGYAPAEHDPAGYHSVGTPATPASHNPTFSQTFGNTLTSLAKDIPAITAVTAAMADGCGLTSFANRYPRRFFDVGIAEEHAMTFSAGLAAGGALPVFAVYSTFFQRCYDQLLHDVALQKLPLLLALDHAGFCDKDGATHHGLFDVPLLCTVPGITLDSPATLPALTACVRAAAENMERFGALSAIRYPKGCAYPRTAAAFPTPAPVSLWGEGKVDTLFITYGIICEEVLIAAERLRAEGKNPAVILLTRIHPLPDLTGVLSGINGIDKIVLVEEGMRSGGIAEKISANRNALSLPDAPATVLAVDGTFVPHGSRASLLTHTHLDADSIYRAATEG